MKKRYIYLLLLCIIMVTGCYVRDHNDDVIGERHEIRLSSLEEAPTPGTRAVTDFPNGGRIGILASTTYNGNLTNWSAYPDINNVGATAVSVDASGVYSFSWDTPKYWPFDGSDLYFMAYSPIADGSLINYILQSGDNPPSLFIGLYEDYNTPDVMYASNNLNPQPYNKTTGAVNLGEFMHALSQLTIEVIADPGMSETIEVSDLTVSTTARSATLMLTTSDNALSVYSADVPYVASLVSGLTSFVNQDIVRRVLLFPGTEDETQISITLIDTSNLQVFTGNYMASFFQSDTPGQPITLQRAKNTVLRIYVRNIGVENPDQDIQLQGIVTEWDERGNYRIPIN